MTAMKDVILSRVLIPLFRAMRRGRVGMNSEATLLSDRRKKGVTALVWALDLELEALEEQMALLEKRLQPFDTVVVVASCIELSPVRNRGWMYEHVPLPAPAAEEGDDDAWRLYASRRIGRIRLLWRPDFEYVVGTEPADFAA